MLDELSNYENLGTPRFFAELFAFLTSEGRNITSNDVKAHFYNRAIDGRYSFDGCVPLALAVGGIALTPKGHIQVNEYLRPTLVSEQYLKNRFLQLILKAVSQDDIFHSIFCSQYTSYDIVYQLIQIDAAAFRFKYANFRDLLIAFDFLRPHPDQAIRKLIVHTKYRKVFDSILTPEIKRRKLGLDQLEQLLEKNRLYGEDAEIWVEKYERIRLVEHTNVKRVERISQYDANAGFDVISFETVTSSEYDRFIEVKSYSGTPTFFWSRNEMDIARLKGNSYYLYLVDRDLKNDEKYSPLIIQNPFEYVLRNDNWSKRVENYYIQLSDKTDVDLIEVSNIE